MFEKADNEEIIWRWGKKKENKEHLIRACEEALQVINLYGITAFSGKNKEQVQVSHAKVKELRQLGFDVYITPLEGAKEHRTITFPENFSDEDLVTWNFLWKRE